ncbi:MAG: hypothetical protein ACRDH8_04385 [Actinomycetota bacterium]
MSGTSGPTQINSVSITAPSAGLLVISGKAFVENNTAGLNRLFELDALLDGSSLSSGGRAIATLFLNVPDSVPDRGSVSYTVVRPVTAGAHTVTQQIETPGVNADYVYDDNELTVLFVPTGGVA